MFETPILFIIFNRPDTTRQTFDVIRRVQPRHLFIAADGPRPDRPEDVQRCASTRAIFEQIDWPCQVRTLFRSENKGCGHGPAEAITWFFDQVESGIVLEDDCLPSLSFFPFCEQLLERYAHDRRVSMIGGTNPLSQWKGSKYSYVFSRLGFSWGWAGWRRAWKDFDYTAGDWFTESGKKQVARFLKNNSYVAHFSFEFDYYFREQRADVWDFQWLFCRFIQGGSTILPTVNLITNIGFGTDSTHTFDSESKTAHVPTYPLVFPLKHPIFQIDTFFDWYVFERFVNTDQRPFWKKVVLKMVKTVTQTP